jgi:hypothetical protein
MPATPDPTTIPREHCDLIRAAIHVKTQGGRSLAILEESLFIWGRQDAGSKEWREHGGEDADEDALTLAFLDDPTSRPHPPEEPTPRASRGWSEERAAIVVSRRAEFQRQDGTFDPVAIMAALGIARSMAHDVAELAARRLAEEE